MTFTSPEDLWAAIQDRATAEGVSWLEEKVRTVAKDPGAIATLFPAVGRKMGRTSLDPGAVPSGDLHAWTLDDAGRTLLLLATGEHARAEIHNLYRYGDAAERRAVLRALQFLSVGDSARPLVEDALRTNDTRLVAAALGPYAFEHLDDETLAQAVLKCVFIGVPISPLRGLEQRTTPDLSRMLAGYVHERIAAGRDVPAEVWTIIDVHPPVRELDAIAAELDHPVEDRRRAAERALKDRRVLQEGV